MVEKNFKQTDIGLIPEDWEVAEIGDSFQFKNGLNKEKKFFGYGYPIVNYMDVFKKTFITSGLIKGRVFLSKQELRNFEVAKGDVLFTRTSETQEEIGYSSVVIEDLVDTVFSGFVLRARPFNNLFDIQFCRYGFSSRIVREQIISNATYTTRALTNGRVLSEIKLPLPPLPEQQAIAENLTHTDKWIESLEKLIAKKRLIKQGTMQKLFSSREDWKIKTIGELCKIKKGELITSSTRTQGDIPVIAGGKSPSYYHNIANRTGKTITISSSGANAGYVGFHDYPIFASDCSTISEEDTYSIEFIYYYLHFKQSVIYSLQTGGAQPHIHPKDISPIVIKLPSVKEQTNIAIILSDMDCEIETLEQKLSKAKQIKQGMMQELLTGRIRLVETIKAEKPKANKGHNEHINDAVLIGTMSACFGSAQFPMTRFKYTKVSYLLKRYKEEQDTGYLKKAAEPYKPKTRYGGAEKIALQNKYVVSQQSTYKGKTYDGFISGENINEAIAYFQEWYGEEALQWISKFKFEKNDNLELWATVDMAIQDLKKEHKLVNVANVKQIIKENNEWKDKLKRPAFFDDNIHNAIIKMNTLFS